MCSSMKLVSSLRFVRNDQVLSCRRCQAFISSLIEQCFSVVQNTCLWVRLSPWDKAVTSDKIVTVQNHTAVMLKASTCLFATQTLKTLQGCTSSRVHFLELLVVLFC